MLKMIKEKFNSGMGRDVIWTFSLQILIMLCSFAINKLLASLIFSSQMQEIVIGQSENMSLLLVALAYAFILAMAQYAFAYYRGIGHFKWFNGSQLAMQLAIIVPLVLLPVLTVSNVFVSWLIITFLLVVYYLGRELWQKRSQLFRFSFSPSRLTPHLLTIVKCSSGRLVADFFQFSLAAFPLIYISNVMGLQDTAYFSIGITFVTMITPLFSFMGILLLPYVSKAIARNEMKSANRLIQHLLLIYVGSALFIFTEFMTTLLLSSDYVVTTDLTRIMALAILPQAAYMLYRNTIDAVSVIPYNAIILGICILAMVISFMLSTTLTQFAWAYFGVSLLQGLLSLITWHAIKKKACQN